MLNNELYNKLSQRFTNKEMLVASRVISEMYWMLYLDDQVHGKRLSDKNFEATWWQDKSLELEKSINNQTD